MAWLELTLDAASRDIGDLTAKLTARGFDQLVIEDQTELEAFLEDNRAYWDYIDDTLQQQLQGLCRIRLYLEDSDRASLQKLQDFAREQGLSLQTKPLPDTDWSTSWQDNYPPQPVGQRLIVLPYWRSEEAGDRLGVILDPGLTFGTGAHPSTQMVMTFLEELVTPGAHCLDLGSGSGILSITALRLGACRAVGVDIDPTAEGVALANAAYNGFDGTVFTPLTGNVTTDRGLMEALSGESYDFVLVNIVADVIISLAPVLPRLLSPDTSLLLSGILDTRLPEVLAALASQGIRPVEVRAQHEWRSIHARLE